MKSTLTLLSMTALLSCFACSSATEGDSQVPAGSGGNATNAGGAGVGGASGASTNAGASSAGANTAGASSGGASQAGSAGTSTGGASTGGSAGSSGSVGVSGSGGSGPLDGAALYASNCAPCHAAQGVGGPLAPEIQHPVRDFSSWVVRNGLPGAGFKLPMAPFTTAELSDSNLTLIWDYLDKPPQPTTGQALYHDYCANCHGADGKGGPTGRAITNELAKLKQQVRSGASLGQFAKRKNFMPAFTTAKISDAELNLIYTYVGSL